jgi:hypothetical protein
MDYNYTLKYRTFDSLLEDVRTDLRSFATDGVIDPAQLIKVAMRVNYDLGLRVYKTKEKVLDVDKCKVQLPEDFYVMNYALLCGECSVTHTLPQGTNVQEVVPEYRPWVESTLCDGTTLPPEQTCLTKCGNSYQLIQVMGTQTRTYSLMVPIKFRKSTSVDESCPNLHYQGQDEAWIRDGFIWTNFETGNLYINYQGAMEDDEGNLLVPDHPMINEYYEYAIKKRILENLLMDGQNVTAQLQMVMGEYRGARNNALSIVNTPNFSEMQKVWAMNRKAMYSKYYDMFKSYHIAPGYRINNAV